MDGELQQIPNKRYFAIGEVSRLCKLEPHVLRYWEQEFTELSPARRQGRRYYTREEVELVRRIMVLLREQGFTINGARKQLKLEAEPVVPVVTSIKDQIDFSIAELNEVLEILAPD